MPRLSTYIRENTEKILAEWETFARSVPGGDTMDIAALRDHAKEMLGVIARDLDAPQSAKEQQDKSRGETDTDERKELTAAHEHGAGRAESGFTVGQMVSEFRALRASVMRLWTTECPQATATDLEDMIRFNEAIDQAIAESITRFTQDVDQTKARFLAILGHDLRTPLGAMLMSSEFLLETSNLDDSARTMLTSMARGARRMNQMVLDLVEFTRTRFGDTVPIERVEMDVRSMIDEVVAEVTASYPRTVLEVETEGELRGHWDHSRLTQALTNLVGNAVQHGSPNSPIIIKATGTGNEVTIAVHNHGPAIPANQTKRIFQVMTQGKDEGSRDRRHLGLGLYIVDKIVTAHGGTVRVDSSELEGTTFTIRLPRSV